jgi:hypothetical protein
MEIDIKSVLEKSKTISDVARIIFGKPNYTNREKCKKILSEHGVDWKEWLKEKCTKEKKYCLNCGKEIVDGDSRKKFCNHSCAASYNNKGVARNGEQRNKKCLYCGKELKKYQRNFCCHEHQNQLKYEQFIERWKNGDESGLIGKYDIAAAVRRYIFEKNENKCEVCGRSYINPYTGLSVLQIHHKDGDCTNNREENLQLLCPTHHAMTENFGSRNKNATRKDNRMRY